MSRSNTEVHIDEINENVTEKMYKKIIHVHLFCLFRIKQVCIILMNEWNSIELV